MGQQQTLKAAREATGWSQTELAHRAHLNKATISKIESGLLANPSNDTVVALEGALQVPRGTLVFGASSVPTDESDGEAVATPREFPRESSREGEPTS